jgi:hypothetical protein
LYGQSPVPQPGSGRTVPNGDRTSARTLFVPLPRRTVRGHGVRPLSQGFNARTGLILIEAEVAGPEGKAGETLVLDTGATSTSLNVSLLRSLGYDPDAATEFVPMATGTAVVMTPRLMVIRLSALGRHAIGLRVLAHSLPAEAALDGLLSLVFFRDLTPTIDFRAGQLTLT